MGSLLTLRFFSLSHGISLGCFQKTASKCMVYLRLAVETAQISEIHPIHLRRSMRVSLQKESFYMTSTSPMNNTRPSCFNVLILWAKGLEHLYRHSIHQHYQIWGPKRHKSEHTHTWIVVLVVLGVVCTTFCAAWWVSNSLFLFEAANHAGTNSPQSSLSSWSVHWIDES